MFSLIPTRYKDVGIIKNLDLERYFLYQQESMDKVILHNRGAAKQLASAHPITNLLSRIVIRNDKDPSYTYNYLIDEEDRLATAMGVSHSGYRGKKRTRNHFYNSKEVYILDKNHGFTKLMPYLGDKWTECQPVRCVKAPVWWNPLNVPTRPDSIRDGDYAVICIDIPMLGYMYHSWVSEQVKLAEGTRQNDMEFVAHYVLPNMLYSQTVACLYELIREVVNFRIPLIDSSNNTYITYDYWDKISDVYSDIVSDIGSNRLRYDTIFNLLPVYGGKVIKDCIVNTSDFITAQNYWAYTATHMTLLEISTGLCVYHGKIDRMMLTNLRKYIRYATSNKYFDVAPDQDIAYVVSERLQMAYQSLS